MDLHCFQSSLPSCLSHHFLDRLSAGTRCAAFHGFTSSLHSTLTLACTHNHVPQSFLLSKYIDVPAIHCWPATASTSKSFQFYAISWGVILYVVICCIPYMMWLQVQIIWSSLLSIQPACTAPSSSGSQ